MNYPEYLMKIDRIVELLKQENTGSADCLARKLMVSRRTIFRYLDELRLKGAEIGYSKSKETYYLNNNFSFTEDFLQSAMKWHSTQLTLVNEGNNNRSTSYNIKEMNQKSESNIFKRVAIQTFKLG